MLILQLSSKHRAIFKPRAQIYLSSEMLEEIQITLILRPSSSFQFKEYKNLVNINCLGNVTEHSVVHVSVTLVRRYSVAVL